MCAYNKNKFKHYCHCYRYFSTISKLCTLRFIIILSYSFSVSNASLINEPTSLFVKRQIEFNETMLNNPNKVTGHYMDTSLAYISSLSEVSATSQTDSTNQTREETLEMLMGPRKKTLTFVLIMGSVYFLILFCGIIGNMCTCLVIILNAHMHTNTNYYLFSLAVSDLFALLSGELKKKFRFNQYLVLES
jgi:hypothetical protein